MTATSWPPLPDAQTLTVTTKEGRLALLDYAVRAASAGKINASTGKMICDAVEQARIELGVSPSEGKQDTTDRLLILAAISERIEERRTRVLSDVTLTNGRPLLTDGIRDQIDAILDADNRARLHRLNQGEPPKAVFADVVIDVEFTETTGGETDNAG